MISYWPEIRSSSKMPLVPVKQNRMQVIHCSAPGPLQREGGHCVLLHGIAEDLDLFGLRFVVPSVVEND